MAIIKVPKPLNRHPHAMALLFRVQTTPLDDIKAIISLRFQTSHSSIKYQSYVSSQIPQINPNQ